MEKEYTVWHPADNSINHNCEFKEKDFKIAGTVNASSKEQAFIYSQSFSSQWEGKRTRSTCIGDIISDGSNYYMVKGMGFTEVPALIRLSIIG